MLKGYLLNQHFNEGYEDRYRTLAYNQRAIADLYGHMYSYRALFSRFFATQC